MTYVYNFYFRIIKTFLILSCVLLLTTFSIYGIYRVQLFNEYTKIMMHYCTVLFMSFLFLTVNKFLHLGETTNIAVCKATGKSFSQLQLQLTSILCLVKCQLQNFKYICFIFRFHFAVSVRLLLHFHEYNGRRNMDAAEVIHFELTQNAPC